MSLIVSFVLLIMNVYSFHAEGKSYGSVKNIIDGNFVETGTFAYQVSLTAYNKHVCGGSIISDQHILTAAHCVIDHNRNFRNRELIVNIGITDLKKPEISGIRIPVRFIYVLREFERSTSGKRSTADIAVLKLSSPIDLENHKELTKLILPQDVFRTFHDENAIVSGFGCDERILVYDEITREHIIKFRCSGHMGYAKIRVLSYEECTEENEKKPLSKDHLCTRMEKNHSNNPKGICKGDSGSPLVFDGNIVIGVVSRGPKNCLETDGKSSIYTRVTSYKSFIENALNNEIHDGMRFAIYTKAMGPHNTVRSTLLEVPNCSG